MPCTLVVQLYTCIANEYQFLYYTKVYQSYYKKSERSNKSKLSTFKLILFPFTGCGGNTVCYTNVLKQSIPFNHLQMTKLSSSQYINRVHNLG